MRKCLLIAVLFIFNVTAMAQQKPAYILYNAKGKKLDYDKMMKQLVKQDIVLIGEFHNNPISHWMQLEITKDAKLHRSLVLGAEMFEQDNQAALDNYLQGKITAKGLDSSAMLWNNYKTDYAPLVNFAKENNISFAATNIPRRYASMVNKGGFEVLDTLSDLEKTWIAPLPFAFDSTLPGYVNMISMMAGHGSYHSDNHDGIVWYLQQARPDLKIATVTTVSQKDIKKLLEENKNKADFIICVDEDMTTTY